MSRALVAADTAPAAQEVVRGARAILDQPSYAWVSVSESAPGTLTWRQGPTEGRTEKDGATYVTLKLRDNSIMMAFLGEKAAINWADQWHGDAELTGDAAWIGDRLRTYKRPGEEALFLARNSEGLSREKEGIYTGQLNDVALKFLLSRGRMAIKDTRPAKGTVRFWLEDGRLEKYSYRIEGRLVRDPEEGPVVMDRTTVVTFKEIGDAEVDLPPEAARKLR